MKRTFLLSMSILAVSAFAAAGGEVSPRLFNTKWKLEGFFSAKANQLEKPDYNVGAVPDSGGKDMYTLEFSSDSVVRHEDREYQVCRGNLARLQFWGLYAADYTRSAIEFEVIIRPTTADSADGERYDRALYLSRKFELKNGKLKLYYGKENDYLLFGSFEQADTLFISGTAASKAAARDVVSAGKNLTAGPNPVGRSSNGIAFFWQGNLLKSSSLSVYNATGSVVKKISLKDNAAGVQSKRVVGSWDLTDRKGRIVPEGTYSVKGKIAVTGGKSEKVSLIVGVR